MAEPAGPGGRTDDATPRRGGADPDPVRALRLELADMHARVDRLERLLSERTVKLDDVAKRFTRVERRIDRASAAFPVRTALSLRRRLYRLLK